MKLRNIQIMNIKGVNMKFLKIILIIVLLTVPLISYGTGTITSGDNAVYLCSEPEEPTTLDEWFCNLSLSEKIEIYINYKGANHD